MPSRTYVKPETLAVIRGEVKPLTVREVEALKFACHFALDEDGPALPTRGPLIRDIRRALTKLEAVAQALSGSRG